MEFIYLEMPAKTFIIPARENQFTQENNFTNAPVRRIAKAMNTMNGNTNSAFTGSHIKNSIWCQQFDLRQTRILRGCQPVIDFDAAYNCRLYVTTMKAMKFQDDIPSIPMDKFKDHFILVFDFNARRYLSLSLPRTSWRTTEAGDEIYFSFSTVF